VVECNPWDQAEAPEAGNMRRPRHAEGMEVPRRHIDRSSRLLPSLHTLLINVSRNEGCRNSAKKHTSALTIALTPVTGVLAVSIVVAVPRTGPVSTPFAGSLLPISAFLTVLVFLNTNGSGAGAKNSSSHVTQPTLTSVFLVLLV
jgi:hypothetical protein